MTRVPTFRVWGAAPCEEPDPATALRLAELALEMSLATEALFQAGYRHWSTPDEWTAEIHAAMRREAEAQEAWQALQDTVPCDVVPTTEWYTDIPNPDGRYPYYDRESVHEDDFAIVEARLKAAEAAS